MDADRLNQKIAVAHQWKAFFESFVGKDISTYINNQWAQDMQRFVHATTADERAILQGRVQVYAEFMDLFRNRIEAGAKAEQLLANKTQ